MKKVMLIGSLLIISSFTQVIKAGAPAPGHESTVDPGGLLQEKALLNLLQGQPLLEQKELSYAIADLFKNKLAWFHFFDMLDEKVKPLIMGENYYFMGKKYLFDFIDKKHPIPYHSLDHAVDYFIKGIDEAKKTGNPDLEVRAAIGLAITKLLLAIYHKDNRYLIPRDQFLDSNLADAQALLQDSKEKTEGKQEKALLQNIQTFGEQF